MLLGGWVSGFILGSDNRRGLRIVKPAVRGLPRLHLTHDCTTKAAMTRKSPPRRRAPADSTSQAPRPVATTAPADAMDSGWQRSLGLTRALLGASLDVSRDWMQGLGDWRQAQATSLRHASERIEQLASQTEQASDWPSLWALQANLASTQWTQAMDDCSALVEQAMQIESRLVERGREDASRLSQRWLDDLQVAPPPAAPSADGFEAPLAMIGQAQAALGELSRIWTQALYNTALPD
jgi:hypothetical protein